MLSWMDQLVSKNLLQILLLVLLIMLDIVWLSKMKSWHVTSLGTLSFLLYWFGALVGKMISDLTHPESPKMMTFKSTFFLEVILLQLEGDTKQMFRDASLTPLSDTVSLKYINRSNKLYCMSVQVTGPISSEGHTCVMWFLSCWPNHEEHIILSFVLTHHRKSRPGGLTPLLLILKNHTFYFWQCCWAPLEQKSVHVNTQLHQK